MHDLKSYDHHDASCANNNDEKEEKEKLNHDNAMITPLIADFTDEAKKRSHKQIKKGVLKKKFHKKEKKQQVENNRACKTKQVSLET